MKRLPPWQLTRTALLRLLFAIALILTSALMSRAQLNEDPFLLEDTPAEQTELQQPEVQQTPGEDAPAEDAPAEPVVRSPAVEAALNSINARDPRSPAELLQAVRILQQLGANEDAKSFLDRVTDQSLNVDQLVEIHKETGTGMLTRIANNRELGSTAVELVHKIFAAVRTTKQDPERLARLIVALANQDDEQRRVAMAGLAEAGGHAIPALLDAYRSPPDGVTPASLDASVARVGGKAEDPLIAALGAPDPYLQQTAARLLGRVGTKRARTHLIRPYFSPNNAVSRAAAASLKQLGMGRPRSVESAVAFLQRQAVEHLQGTPPIPAGFDGILEMWTWSGEEKNVVPHRLVEREAAAVAAARVARDAYELSKDPERTRLLLASRLQVDQLLGGLDEKLQRGAGTAYELGVKAGSATMSDVLAYSLENGLDAAAIGAAEVLGDLADESVVMGREWSPLARALQSSNRRVRYAAARAIVSIDPRTAYPGASILLETLIDLANATGRPSALIGTPRRDVSVQLAGMLGGLGFAIQRRLEGRDVLREAVRTSDYDVLLLSDSVSRPVADETLQQLRKDPRSKHLPVVLLVRMGQLDRAEQLASRDDKVVVMPEFADEQTLIAVLSAVEQMVEHVSVSPQRRLVQAKHALGWLGHLAEYSQTYSWYDIMRAQPVAERAISVAALSSTAVELMGYLGTPSAQRQLLETASQNTVAVAERQRAVNAFAESVLRRGLLLREADVVRQYDRYNASETADQATQEVLGQILDVIETQTKPAAAP